MGPRLFLVLALALAASMPADACPAGRPCLKYRRPPPPPPPRLPVHYTRTAPATPDRFDRASLVRLLTGSTWSNGRDVIRFVDPMHVESSHFARPPGRERPGDARVVLIRELERTRAGVFVGIDGALFTLSPCQVGRMWTSCLDESRATDAQLFGGLGYGGATYGR